MIPKAPWPSYKILENTTKYELPSGVAITKPPIEFVKYWNDFLAIISQCVFMRVKWH